METVTVGEWITEGSFVYALEEHGWRLGKPDYRNRFYFKVYGNPDTPQSELNTIATLAASAPKLRDSNAELLAALKLAYVALENSAPEMTHYPEPVKRHAEAVKAVKSAISKAKGV